MIVRTSESLRSHGCSGQAMPLRPRIGIGNSSVMLRSAELTALSILIRSHRHKSGVATPSKPPAYWQQSVHLGNAR